MRQEGAEVAVAQMLLEYGDDVAALTPAALKALTARYDVEYASHLKIMTKMYTDYLLAMLDWPEVRMHEPTALVELSVALGLDSSTIGDAHCAAAEEVREDKVVVILTPGTQWTDDWGSGVGAVFPCFLVASRHAGLRVSHLHLVMVCLDGYRLRSGWTRCLRMSARMLGSSAW